MKKQLLSDRDCSAIFGCSQSTWWRWVKNKQVPQPIRIGGRTLWHIDDIEASIASLQTRRGA